MIIASISKQLEDLLSYCEMNPSEREKQKAEIAGLKELISEKTQKRNIMYLKLNSLETYLETKCAINPANSGRARSYDQTPTACEEMYEATFIGKSMDGEDE